MVSERGVGLAKMFGMERKFRIRRVGGKNKAVSVLTVPAEIAKQLDPELEFTVRMTKAGLLYAPAKSEAPELPAWAKRQQRHEQEPRPTVTRADQSPPAKSRGQRQKKPS